MKLHRYQSTHDRWINKYSGRDLLRDMLRCEHHPYTDIYKNIVYINYAVGFKYLTAGDLINRPKLAKALRNIQYPAVGETLILDKKIFNDQSAGIDNLLACVTWLKEAQDRLLAKKLAADQKANDLIMLYEDIIEIPIVTDHAIMRYVKHGGYALDLEISGVGYYFNSQCFNADRSGNTISRELCVLDRRDFFYNTHYNSAYSIEPIGYIKNTPFIKFFAKTNWNSKGHIFWLDLDTGNISRATNTIKELANKFTDKVEIIEISIENS